LNPSTTFEEALDLATYLGTPDEAFRWFPVSKSVNKAGNDDPAFNEPIEDPKV
jgi:putative SOS response-associated peptidase YedK